MEKIKAVIVESSPGSKNWLSMLLASNCRNISVAGVAGNVADGVELIRSKVPSLLFVDKDLPDGTGLDVLSSLQPFKFRVIFMGNNLEDAYMAIKAHADDFILKPVNVKELVDSVRMVCCQGHGRLKAKANGNNNGDHHNGVAGNCCDRITLADSNGFTVIGNHEIIKMEANGNYTDVYLTGNRKLTYCRMLKEFCALLNENPKFMRTHRSYIINLDHVKSFSRQGIIHLNDDLTAHCGDSFKTEFVNYFIHVS